MGGPVGGLDLIFDENEASRLDILARLTVSKVDSVSHFSRFLVAELDAIPAAALMGYRPNEFASGAAPRSHSHGGKQGRLEQPADRGGPESRRALHISVLLPRADSRRPTSRVGGDAPRVSRSRPKSGVARSALQTRAEIGVSNRARRHCDRQRSRYRSVRCGWLRCVCRGAARRLRGDLWPPRPRLLPARSMIQ